MDAPGDGLPPGEGAFLACTFWLVDNYILEGRHLEARKLFERLLSHCNDVGLLAEEYDPIACRMLGNSPQAYSHVGLICCALNLTRETCPMEERAEPERPPTRPTPGQGGAGLTRTFPLACNVVSFRMDGCSIARGR